MEVLKSFFERFVGEEPLSSLTTYPDMKNFYPTQVIDCRFQVDHKNPKKIHIFEDFRSAMKNARLFMTKIRHEEFKIVSDGKKLLKFNKFKKTIFRRTEFMRKFRLKDETMNETDFKQVYNYPIYPSDFNKIYLRRISDYR